MNEPLRPLSHEHVDGQDEDTRAREAAAHLAHHPQLQLMAELMTKLRAMHLPWWSPESLRRAWPARTRMTWLAERPELRAEITSKLTGLPRNAARSRSLPAQADLIDAVLDSGDVSVETFELAFDPSVVAAYGPAAEIWTEVRTRFEEQEDSPAHQRLVAWLIRTLLTDRNELDGTSRKPILGAWEVRTSIDPVVWHTRMPLEVRVAIDDARLRQEKTRPRDPFHARYDIHIATPEVIAQSIPLAELTTLFALAERALGFAPEGSYVEAEPEPTPAPQRISTMPPPVRVNGDSHSDPIQQLGTHHA